MMKTKTIDFEYVFHYLFTGELGQQFFFKFFFFQIMQLKYPTFKLCLSGTSDFKANVETCAKRESKSK